MMFYSGNPDVRQYEERARQARAEVIAAGLLRLRDGVGTLTWRARNALVRHTESRTRLRATRVACQD